MDLPDRWDVAPLDRELISVKSGFAFAKSKLAEAGIPHLRPFNINSSGDLDLSTLYYLPEEGIRDLKPFRLESGDLLFNNTSSVEVVGKSALAKDDLPWGFSNHVTRLRVTAADRLRPEWLLLCLRSLWRARFFEREANRWIGQAGFAPTRLATVEIPLPDLGEQGELVERYAASITDVRAGHRLLHEMAILPDQMDTALLREMAPALPQEV